MKFGVPIIKKGMGASLLWRSIVFAGILYSMIEFKELASDYNIGNYFFIGSSFIETYNPFSFYKRKYNLFRETSKIKKEKTSRLDKYLGREITFIAQKN